MIISCEKCKKKFEVDDNLIPKSGRLLQCGSCSHKWQFIPTKTTPILNEAEKVEKIDEKKEYPKKNERKKITISISPAKPIINVDEDIIDESTNLKESKKRKKSFLHLFIAFIISSIALLILIETFKTHLYTIFPNIDFYLNSLYETLEDIFLFFKDLIN